MNKPSWISPHEGLQSQLINTAYQLLRENNKGEGGGGGEGGLVNFLPLKRGGLKEDLRYDGRANTGRY